MRMTALIPRLSACYETLCFDVAGQKSDGVVDVADNTVWSDWLGGGGLAVPEGAAAGLAAPAIVLHAAWWACYFFDFRS